MPIPAPGTQLSRKKVVASRHDHARKQALYGFLYDSLTGEGGYEPFMGGYTSSKARVEGKSVDGDPGVLTVGWESSRNFYTYLKPHKREEAAKFKRRWEAAAYANYLEWIVRIWVGLLTRQPPKRPNFPDAIQEWQSEANWWLYTQRTIVPWGLTFGRHWTVITKDIDGVTRPKLLSPHAVLDWIEDENGLIEIKYVIEHDPTLSTYAREEPHLQVWVLSRDGWFFVDLPQDEEADTVLVEDSGAWEKPILGTCPVVPYMRGERGDSALYFLAQISRRMFNVMSLKTEIEDLATFPMMYIPTWDEKGEAFRNWLSGTGVALPIPKDATIAPDYMAYDIGPHTTLAEEQDRLISMMRTMAALTIGSQQQSGAATGIASAYEFLLTGATLADFSKDFADHGLKVAGMVSLWEGGEPLPDEAKEEWSKRYDLTEKKEVVAAIDTVLAWDPGDLASKALKKKAVGDILASDMSEMDIEDIYADIDAMEEPEGADGLEPTEGDPFEGVPEAKLSIS